MTGAAMPCAGPPRLCGACGWSRRGRAVLRCRTAVGRMGGIALTGDRSMHPSCVVGARFAGSALGRLVKAVGSDV